MNSFLHKIEAERIVLRTVNERYRVDSLHGLSAGAIATWAQDGSVSAAFIAEVSELGQMIGAMCERSGERDSSPDRIRRARVARAVREFKARHG